MNQKDLKAALLTLRSVSGEGEEVYKALLTASTGLGVLMTADFLQGVRLKNAFESEEGRLLKVSLAKASKLVPWFATCDDEFELVMAIVDLLRNERRGKH